MRKTFPGKNQSYVNTNREMVRLVSASPDSDLITRRNLIRKKVSATSNKKQTIYRMSAVSLFIKYAFYPTGQEFFLAKRIYL